MGDMKKTSSLADLGVDADIGKSIFKKIYYHAVMDTPTKSYTKITIVDVGNVGMAIAQTILTQDIVEELALIGTNFDKFQGEMLDLQHATAFLPRVQIQADTDYAITAQSNLCIIAAGSQQNPRETRLDLLQHNLNIFRSIVPKLVEKSSGCLLLVVTNPVDVLTYITWKLSGFPPNRVIGSGTNLDSSRFRFLLADYLDVNAQDIQAYMVGEHGDSLVAL
ncbi:L-lactate dehydrogenase [Zostera marina]|uniref:L-lactate dehydrogenase n=1 Tax=Zostera marina TaxID=29655 RepID=A0A0K9NND1_ZOSMR|nr:L-lactate dehydrogenase [Zostera marina]